MSKAGRRALVGSIAAVTFAAALLAVAQDQETLQVRSAVSAADAESPAYIAALVGSSVSRSNSYDVLRNGDEIFPAMLHQPRHASNQLRNVHL